MLAWIASYPRSGNTFFRLALFRVYGQKSTADKLRRPEAEAKKPRLECALRTTLTDEEMAADKNLYFVKRHFLPYETAHPAIYLVRDGRDALVSYAWYSLGLHKCGVAREDITQDQFRDALRNLIISKRHPFGNWSRNVLAWTKRPNTLVVKFEDLIRTPEKCVTRAVETLDLPCEKVGSHVPSFAELHSTDPGFFRRGIAGSWRDELPPDLHDLFWKRHRRVVKATGYDRQQIRTSRKTAA